MSVVFICPPYCFFFFFFNDTATTEIYTLSLHDALPISSITNYVGQLPMRMKRLSPNWPRSTVWSLDRKSTRLNSSHSQISYAVFCLKKKNQATHNGEVPPVSRWGSPRRVGSSSVLST